MLRLPRCFINICLDFKYLWGKKSNFFSCHNKCFCFFRCCVIHGTLYENPQKMASSWNSVQIYLAKQTSVAGETTNSRTFHPTKLGVKIRAEEWSNLQNPKHLMTGKYTSLIGLMSGVRDGLEFISLYLRACEMYQALLTRSPLTTKAVGGNGPKVKLREAAESHTWSPTMVTKQELLIACKNSTAPLKAYQQLLK